MARARILNDGSGQSIRLPKSCRFPDDQKEVIVRKEGDRLVLEPVSPSDDEWPEEFVKLLGSIDEPIERMQRPVGKKRDPFD